MSQQISKSLYIFYEIVQFLSYEEKLRMQLISRKFYDNIIPYNISTSSVRSAPHAQHQDRVFQYSSGHIMYRELGSIIKDVENLSENKLNPENRKKWQYLRPRNTDYVQRHCLNKQLKFGRTIYIPYNKVLVISGDNVDVPKDGPVNDTFIYDLMSETVEMMPSIRVARTSFAAHYDFGDRFVYVIGGSNYQEKMVTDCEKFDVLNQKWVEMPSLNLERGNPGTFISDDRRYLYAFQGFKNTNGQNGPFGFKQSEALRSIERLDLWNEHLGWQLHQLSCDQTNIPMELEQKGCFIMFNFNDFDLKKFQMETKRDAHLYSDISSLEEAEEEKESECMQIDSSSSPFQSKSMQADLDKFERNAEQFDLRDKVVIFGGWKPYENLTKVEVYDKRKNQIEDVLPLALNMRGKHFEAKKSTIISKMISASTARESNLSESSSDSEYSDHDNEMQIIENMQTPAQLQNYNSTPIHRTQLKINVDQINEDEQNLDNLSQHESQINSSDDELAFAQFESPQVERDNDSSDMDDDESMDGDEQGQEEAEDILEHQEFDTAQAQLDYNAQVKNIYSQYGDKFTKKPLQCGKYLILLGRVHILTFDVLSFKSRILPYYGEDQAEKQGNQLRKQQQEEQEKSSQKSSRFFSSMLTPSSYGQAFMRLNPNLICTTPRSDGFNLGSYRSNNKQ